jgi:hypothetical protein
VCLLAPADDAGLEPGAALDLGEQLGAVARVADSAGRDGHHVVDARGLAERGEHRGGMQGAVDAVRAQQSLVAHSRADAHRLADLVDQAPPGRSRHISEHDEAPRVGPHVDDGDPLHKRDDAPQPQFRARPCRCCS